MSDDTSAPDQGMPPAEEMSAPEAAEVPAPPMESPPAAPYPPPPAQYAPPPPPYMPQPEGMPQRPGPATDSSKVLAALGYLFPIIAIVMLFVEPYKDEKFVKFHAVQALGVAVLYLAVGVISWVPIIGWFLWILPLALAIVACVKAFQGQYWEIPLLYDVVKGFIDK